VRLFFGPKALSLKGYVGKEVPVSILASLKKVFWISFERILEFFFTFCNFYDTLLAIENESKRMV
jgi:hypothetical protein